MNKIKNILTQEEEASVTKDNPPLSLHDNFKKTHNNHNVLALTANQISYLLSTKRLTCVDLMRMTLHQIHTLNPNRNAIIQLQNPKTLISLAREADNYYQLNKRRKSWLHGIPLAIKDMIDVTGMKTVIGSPLLATLPNKEADDEMVSNLRTAGAIFIGKTNVPEMCLGSHTFNSVYGATINPFSSINERGSLSAGGSSGGAAAALASHMVCLADGSDMMGSLRNPAGWNQVYSFRPSMGMLSSLQTEDEFGFPWPISTKGPMARSPLDLTYFLHTMMGRSLPEREVLSDLIRPDVSGWKVGWLADWSGAYPMEDGVLDLCQNILHGVFSGGLKCQVASTSAPFSSQKLWKAWTTIRSYHLSNNKLIKNMIEQQSSSPKTAIKEGSPLQWEIRNASSLTKTDIENAISDSLEFSQCMDQLFQKFDVLALPSAQVFPFLASKNYPEEISGKRMDTYHRWMEVSVPVSLIHLPCVTIPVGFWRGDKAKPMGIQFFAKRGTDHKLLELAQAYYLQREEYIGDGNQHMMYLGSNL